jgi:predicted RNA-binding Zn-ribbon protein involved in translation (DUF1610 family)
MNKAERFETVCRLMNKVLEQRDSGSGKIKVTEAEVAELVTALEYYRKTVNPSSGDILMRTEYSCPECGNTGEFRAQKGQVSLEAAYPEIGVEVMQVLGVAHCRDCKLQVNLNQFKPIQLDGFDEAAWETLYEEKYRDREVVAKLQPA